MKDLELFNKSVEDNFQTDKLESYKTAFIWWENGLTQIEARAEAKETNNREAYMIYTNGVYTDKLNKLGR